MGTELYVVRHDKKELFELGKHCLWKLVGDRDKLWAVDKNKLLARIVESWAFNENMSCGYALWVRDKIWDWIQGTDDKNLEVISEYRLEDPPYVDPTRPTWREQWERLYKVTGSRYAGDVKWQDEVNKKY